MPMGATVKIIADAAVGAGRRAMTKVVAVKVGAGLGGLAALARTSRCDGQSRDRQTYFLPHERRLRR